MKIASSVMNTPYFFAAILGLVAVSAMVTMLPSGEPSSPIQEVHERSEKTKAKGWPLAKGPESRRTFNRGKTLEEVLTLLPATGSNLRELDLRDETSPLVSLFRRLGELEGEGAIDEILGRYGTDHSFSSLAITHALLGWREIDNENAFRALDNLVGLSRPHDPLFLMKWRGEKFLSALS